MEKLVGGYVTLKTRAIKNQINPHTDALERPVGPRTLEGLNWVQMAPWRINPFVLSTLGEMIEAGVVSKTAGIPSSEPIPAPMLPQDEYDALDEDGRKALVKKREAIHGANAHAAALRTMLFRRLSLARELAQHRAVWFPHFLDFRGRVYPLPQDLTPQGDSLCKGLLEFSEARHVDERGLYWLKVAFANAMGHDKLPLDERADWTDAHEDRVEWMSRSPLDMLDFWTDPSVDSPWEALALARAIVAASLGFPVRVPVRLDATCSGIQHLAALMRDPLSARCVNLMDTGKREDIYGDVATNASNRVALDAADGNALAMLWLGKVTRKTVKRAVMTTPYGVTPRGITEQLVLDGFCDHIESSLRYKAADYMRDVIVASLDANIGEPRRAMQFFQDVAVALAESEKPMQWRTPADLTVRQAYFETRRIRHETLIGKIDEFREDESLGLVTRKQALASAPNVIHSFDAAHLMRTAVACKRANMRDLAFVHDSYGTHASDIDTLGRLLREEFVSIYSEPQLALWRESVIQLTGVTDLPEAPALGDLDVRGVLNSPFFFS
jgi:DNA-directed RNA polymerase